MVKKRRCSVCSRWFQPDVRLAGRQHACGKAECQRERHRRACKAWHERERDDEQDARLVRRLLPAAEPAPSAGPAFDWQAARDAIGTKACVVIREFVRVAVRRERDAMRSELVEVTGRSRGHARPAARDAMARTGSSP